MQKNLTVFGMTALLAGGSVLAYLKTPLDPIYLALTLLMLVAVAIRVMAYWKSSRSKLSEN